jgi:hypothetical protein
VLARGLEQGPKTDQNKLFRVLSADLISVIFGNVFVFRVPIFSESGTACSVHEKGDGKLKGQKSGVCMGILQFRPLRPARRPKPHFKLTIRPYGNTAE